MEVFGIEITRKSTVKEIYRQVDLALKKHNITSGEITVELRVQAIEHKIQSIFNKSFFSVTYIKELSEFSFVKIIGTQRYSIYRALHCMQYADMTDVFRNTLKKMVLEDFGVFINKDYENTKITKEFLCQFVQHSIKNLFRFDNFMFYIFDEILSGCEIYTTPERYAFYKNLNDTCWGDMEPNYKEKVIAMIFDDFRGILNPEYSGVLEIENR